jgi:hypothetical protein
MRTLAPLLLLLAGCPSTRVDLVGVDEDEDGYGSWVDCDDDDAGVNPGTTEVPYNGVDDDCDTDTPDDDLDGDTYDDADDCDDTDPTSYPGADEICDGIDNDCDTDIDETISTPWYADDDGDGFGDPLDTEVRCDDGDGAWVANDDDCDDGDAAIHPGAIEVCDGEDNDCDGDTDVDPLFEPTWYEDVDSDTFGDPASTLVQCDQPAGYVANGDDCDDNETDGNLVYPGADEMCDARDRNCDGLNQDGAIDTTTWYLDHDNDSYGDADVTLSACTQPSGYVSNALDCHDYDGDANPDGSEVCNGIDDDCANGVDDDAIDELTWYRDVDGDGYGNDTDPTTDACTQPSGYAGNDDDCNDNAITAHPLGVEGTVCADLDNDCNGVVDDIPTAPVWFEDFDSDTYGDPDVSVVDCDQPAGYVSNNDDCDDTDGTIKPTATESCDGVDEDCDGLVDDGAAPLLKWYLDADGDWCGDQTASVSACSKPGPAYVAEPPVTDPPPEACSDYDCDDEDPDIYPDNPTLGCDGLDHDCDGNTDNDGDGDGFLDPSACPDDGLDCNDENGSIYPGVSCGWGESCLEAMANNASFTTNDWVLIDPDGMNTGDDPELFWCDFTDNDAYGPGWTMVYWADFESGADASGWDYFDYYADDTIPANATPTACETGNQILGGYDKTSGGFLFRDFDDEGVDHEEILVNWYYYQIDSWDTGQAPPEAGWLLLEHNTSTVPPARTEDPDPEPYITLWYMELAGLASSDLCGDTEDDDAYYHRTRLLWDDDDAFRLEFGADLSSSPTNESFGIDDVSVWVR